MLAVHLGLGLKDLDPRTSRMLLSGQDQRPENLAGPIATRAGDSGVLSVEEHAQLQENEVIFPLSVSPEAPATRMISTQNESGSFPPCQLP